MSKNETNTNASTGANQLNPGTANGGVITDAPNASVPPDVAEFVARLNSGEFLRKLAPVPEDWSLEKDVEYALTFVNGSPVAQNLVLHMMLQEQTKLRDEAMVEIANLVAVLTGGKQRALRRYLPFDGLVMFIQEVAKEGLAPDLASEIEKLVEQIAFHERRQVQLTTLSLAFPEKVWLRQFVDVIRATNKSVAALRELLEKELSPEDDAA